LNLSIHPLEANSTLPEIDPQVSDTQTEPESALHWPSLGYLDEALGFIAAERARWTAARESTNEFNAGGNSSETGAISEGEAGGEDESINKEEEDAWNQVFGTSFQPIILLEFCLRFIHLALSSPFRYPFQLKLNFYVSFRN
jgi:hypothetical protein